MTDHHDDVRRAADTPGPAEAWGRRRIDRQTRRVLSRVTGREFPTNLTVGVLNALLAEDVPAWLAGGWGVDALLGAQTRRHADLDVVVDRATPDVEARVTRGLAQCGFGRVDQMRSIEPMPVVWVYRDSHGASVEVLPVELGRWPFRSNGALTTGVIDVHRVPCLSAPTQLALRTGYRLRRHDRDDVRHLCARFGLDLPEGF